MNSTPLALAAAAALIGMSTDARAQVDPLELARCDKVTVSAPVNFQGRTLKEIPDISEPELRLVNQLLSSGCNRRAQGMFVSFLETHPDNFHVKYHEARREWMADGDEEARRMLEEVLERHPDFNSARVLLASMLLREEDQRERGLQLLDEAERNRPDDLWVFLDRLMIQAQEEPSSEVQQRALEIARNPAFPPNAREFAVDLGTNLPGLSQADLEQFLYARLDVESFLSMACKYAELAEQLSKQGDRFDEVRRLLESPAASRGNCLGIERNRVLLAQAYLMQAAAIAPAPAPANAALVVKAWKVLDGDLDKLVAHARGEPQFRVLQPFLLDLEARAAKASAGTPEICRSVAALDHRAILKYLAAGGDPNATCQGGETLVASLVHQASNPRTGDLQITATVLLEHGARPAGIEACAKIADCTWSLMPILENYPR
jgi:tetratricopeptide (TPR) repeat protein